MALNHENLLYRYEKQCKQLKEKGYFTMADGTKSTDHEVPAKKKAKSETKPGKKRTSGASDSAAKEKKKPGRKPSAQKKSSDAKADKKKDKKEEDSADDLDIQSEDASADNIEASD